MDSGSDRRKQLALVRYYSNNSGHSSNRPDRDKSNYSSGHKRNISYKMNQTWATSGGSVHAQAKLKYDFSENDRMETLRAKRKLIFENETGKTKLKATDRNTYHNGKLVGESHARTIKTESVINGNHYTSKIHSEFSRSNKSFSYDFSRKTSNGRSLSVSISGSAAFLPMFNKAFNKSMGNKMNTGNGQSKPIKKLPAITAPNLSRPIGSKK
jgi:hypothetical protein